MPDWVTTMSEATSLRPDSKTAQKYSVAEATELKIGIKHETKGPGKYNPKLSVFREFVLASVYTHAEENQQGNTSTENDGNSDARQQLYACDLATHSGLAGLQWKKHLGGDVNVTVVEPRDKQQLITNVKENGFFPHDFPLHPDCPAGSPLVHQSQCEIHVARCDPGVLMLLEAFDFVYVDPHKNPSPYFSTLFRNIRNDGIACIVVPDTMHFARAPHVVRRSYGANCIKTEYLKELAVRIVTASLASEAAKCNKGLTVLYAVSFEDFLLLCVRVKRGPKMADATLLNIGQVLHCRICEERAFYPDLMAPQEDAYKMLGCRCQENVPGKTAVIVGPLWKGSLYTWQFLQKLASAGQDLSLSQAFFSLLQRVMEDCLCDTPPTLSELQNIPRLAGRKCAKCKDHSDSKSCAPDAVENGSQSTRSSSDSKEMNVNGKEARLTNKNCNFSSDSDTSKGEGQKLNVVSPAKSISTAGDATSVATDSKDVSVQEERELVRERCKRSADEGGPSISALETQSQCKRQRLEEEASPQKRLKMEEEPSPAPCFYYSVHSKRLGKSHLPKQHAIIERLRAHGFRCCRTHFDKYAIRTDADMSTLTTLLGTGESKVIYVKGLESCS